MVAPTDYAVRWRAFVGPPWRSSGSAAHWDWSALSLAAYDPVAVIANTTLNGTVTLSAVPATIVLTDASTYPTAGGFWMAGNGTGETWGYVEYTGKSSNTVTRVRDDYEDASEYSGAHTTGAAVRFWWPLDEATGVLRIEHFAEGNLVGASWRGTISGVNFPMAALRKGHLLLVQTATANIASGAWNAWTNSWIGWIETVRVQDNGDSYRRWSAEFVSSAGVMAQLAVDGIRVGNEQLIGRLSASSSGTLGRAYKAANLGEFAGAVPNLSAGSSVDGDMNTLWISDRYVGQTNDYTLAGAGNPWITHIHLREYPGQTGTRWIEITFRQSHSGTLAFYLITQDGHTLDFDGSGYDISAVAGDRIILAENETRFSSVHPDHGATDVVDLSEIQLKLAKWKITTLTLTGNPTGGTFTVDAGLNSAPRVESNAISITATADDVFGHLAPITNIGNYMVSGPTGGPWTIQWYNSELLEDFTTLSDFALKTNSLTGGTSPSVTVDNLQQGQDALTTATGTNFFDEIDVSDGWLMLFHAPGAATANVIVWGNPTYPAPSFQWTTSGASANPGGSRLSTNLVAQRAGETYRYIYNPVSTTKTADYWDVGNVATPGYESNDIEWLLIEMPGMGLQLDADIDDSTTSMVFADIAGPSGDGLPDSGTVQIGSEQISYTSIDRTTGVPAGTVTRGANSTIAAAHIAGDPIFLIDGGIAIDARPVASLSLKRKSGVPVLEDFNLRYSPFEDVRSPDQTNYTQDWPTSDTITGNATATYTKTFGTPLRMRWLLVEIGRMGTQPYQAMINEVTFAIDNSVIDSSRYLEDVTVGEVMAQLAGNAGVPAAAVIDTTTTDVDTYTTSKASLWPVILDLADFGNKRIVVERDSKITISDDTFWAPASAALPSSGDEAGEFTRDELEEFTFDWVPGRNVNSVTISWRSPDGVTSGEAEYPAPGARDDFGMETTIGPFIYADATAAQNAAIRRYLQIRRPHSFIGEVISASLTYAPLQFWGAQWDMGTGYRIVNRTMLLESAQYEFRDGASYPVVSGIQVSRTDEL